MAMENIVIQLEFLKRQENHPDEYDRRSISVSPVERLLRFRDRVAELYGVPANSIKLINRGKLVELNPMYNLTDIGIDQHNPVFVTDKKVKAPSMSRRRPQSSAQPFLPHANPSTPSIFQLPSGRTLTELSVNRYVLQVIIQEGFCPLSQLDSIVRTIAESYRIAYNVDVDVQRRNRRPYENDVSFDVAFRGQPVMPSGAYNRFEAIKAMLIRQKMLMIFIENHIAPHFEASHNGEFETFSDDWLKEVDKIDGYEVFAGRRFFTDDESHHRLQEFVARFRSEVEDDLPLLGNILQVRHLIPQDYYNMLNIISSIDADIQKITGLQQNSFATEQVIDSKICDLLVVLLRRLRHIQSHISHILSEISLRPNDSLRVAYPQGVLTTFSGLNPDITCTITFTTGTLNTFNNNQRPNDEMNTARFTTFHQVHVAMPVIRAMVQMEVEIGTEADINHRGRPQAPPMYTGPLRGPHRNTPRHMAVHPVRYASRYLPGRGGHLRGPFPAGTRHHHFDPLNPSGPMPQRANQAQGNSPQNLRSQRSLSSTSTRERRASSAFANAFSNQNQRPSGNAATGTPNASTSSPGRSIRDLLQSISGHQVQVGSQNGNNVQVSSNDLLNPLNSIFRAVESNENSAFNEGNASGSESSTPSSPQGVLLNDFTAFANGNNSGVFVQQQERPNQQVPHHHHHHHNHGPHIVIQQPNQRNYGLPVNAQQLQTAYSNTTPRQARNLGPHGGCPLAYAESFTSENLESHATAQEITTHIADADLVPAIQRYPLENNILRRNNAEFAVLSTQSLETLLKAYMQGLVSYNTGRQIANPAVMNEISNQGHRIQVRRASYRDRTHEFYRLLGSREIVYIRELLQQSSFLEDRGFLGIVVTTVIFSLNFDIMCQLLQTPLNLGALREAMKVFVFQRFSTHDIESIDIASKLTLSENFYHYILNVAPFALTRDDKNMVGTLQKMDASMLSTFYKILLEDSSDEDFSKAFLDLLRSYHSLLISFCYVASNGFSHAYREFIRILFLDIPTFNDVHKDYALDVFMESLVSMALSFDNPEVLKNIDVANVTEYFLSSGIRFSPEPGTFEAPLGAFRQNYPSAPVVNIDTTVPSPSLPSQMLDEDVE